MQNIPKRFTQYAEDVISGKIPAGQYIILACKKYMSFFDKYWFDVDKIEKIERFFLHMKHFEGEFNNKPFTLLPWELFVICAIFGFYQKDDHTKRVTRNVYLLISRKNGKTGLSAAIMLANMMCDAEPGYEGYLVANNTQQARIAFKFITGFARSLDPQHKHIKIYRDYITYDRTHSMIKVLSSDSMGQDGYNPSTFLCDEFAAAKTYDSYNILKSGMTMRKNPLAITISSAGFLLDTYPMYESCKVGERCLKGEFEDDHTFYCLYQLDDGDDYRDESVWQKACPSYPHIVQKDYMLERIQEAEQNTAKKTDVLTKNFNVWCTAQNAWLDSKFIKECHGTIDLKKLEGENCYIGVDLSATRDLTAMSLMFPPNSYRDYYPDKYIWINYTWIPHYAMKHSNNAGLYEWFVDMGYATVTPGNTVDYTAVELKIQELAEMFNIVKISYDQWQAALFTQHMIGLGFPMEPFAQTLGSFNRPTKTFEVLVINKQCVFDVNPMILWMFSHCELIQDHMNNCKPTKAAENQLNKIDNIISMLEALGGHLFDVMGDSGEVIDLALSGINTI